MPRMSLDTFSPDLPGTNCGSSRQQTEFTGHDTSYMFSDSELVGHRKQNISQINQGVTPRLAQQHGIGPQLGSPSIMTHSFPRPTPDRQAS